jgi:sec-independent protein translocase protein TatB
MGIQPTIEVASLGMWDSVILMVMALVVFGPRRLPEIGRQIGKLMYEFRKASNEFKYQMEEELRSAEEADRLKKQEERLKELGVTIPASPVLEASVPSEAAPPVTIASLVAESEAKSPYPGEETYPATPSVDPESPAQETVPRILPPSTGEPVPAARPGSLASQLQSTELPAEETVQEQP